MAASPGHPAGRLAPRWQPGGACRRYRAESVATALGLIPWAGSSGRRGPASEA